MAEGVYPKADGDILFASETNDLAGNTVEIEAGENITAGNAIYIDETDGKAYVSDSGNAADNRCDGIAQTTATSGNDCQVLLSGVRTTSGLTDKEDYYVGAAGAITTTISEARVGTALSTTRLLVKPQHNFRARSQHVHVQADQDFAQGAGTWAWVKDTNVLTLQGYMANEATNADADNISFEVWLDAGTYSFAVNYSTDNNTGIVDIDIDGTEIVTALDTYSAAVVYDVRNVTTSIAIADSGLKTVRFTLDGKNGASSDHRFRFHFFRFWKTG